MKLTQEELSIVAEETIRTVYEVELFEKAITHFLKRTPTLEELVNVLTRFKNPEDFQTAQEDFQTAQKDLALFLKRVENVLFKPLNRMRETNPKPKRKTPMEIRNEFANRR